MEFKILVSATVAFGGMPVDTPPNRTVPDCEYYNLVNGNDASDIYCIACKYGFRGKVYNDGTYDYIRSCEAFTDCEAFAATKRPGSFITDNST